MSVLVEVLIHGGALAVFFGLEGAFPFFPGRTGRLRHAFPNLSLALLAAAASGLVALLLAFRPAAGAVGYGLLPGWGSPPGSPSRPPC
ncbi:MAG: hypothetical protein P9M08_01250 [Candidatus Erginobacter occultus]|nr:hypothetical protein [Candidatus Erginobacter occultus]